MFEPERCRFDWIPVAFQLGEGVVEPPLRRVVEIDYTLECLMALPYGVILWRHVIHQTTEAEVHVFLQLDHCSDGVDDCLVVSLLQWCGYTLFDALRPVEAG